MRVANWLVCSAAAAVVFFGCTADRNTENPLTENDSELSSANLFEDFEKGVGDKLDREVAVNPNRENYDVVVLDVDRWELCMNVHRVRPSCTSYTGHMWYQMGSFIFKGTLTAVYNNQLDMLTVTALDSGWDRGHIIYGLQFIEGTNDLYGSFAYFEYPRRVNGINAWLEQGTMGPHVYGTAPTAAPSTGPVAVTDVHPKRARVEGTEE